MPPVCHPGSSSDQVFLNIWLMEWPLIRGIVGIERTYMIDTLKLWKSFKVIHF